MTRTCIPWNPALKDSGLTPWLSQAADVTEVLVHSTAPAPAAMAEFFTAPNGGTTIGDQIAAAKRAGHEVILNIDPHHGNGRSEDGGSATGKGRYHNGMAEGGMTQALDAILRWPQTLLDPVIAIQIMNEPINRAWLANWIADFLQRGAGAKIRQRGWKVVIDGSSEHINACAHLADVIDPHQLFVTPAAVGAVIRQMVRQNPGKEIWVTELAADQASQTAEVARACVANGAHMVSVFSGNRTDFAHGRVVWNSRTFRPPFNCWAREGLTEVGREWEEFRGMNGEEPGPGPTPGPDPGPTPEPPPDANEPEAVTRIRKRSLARLSEPPNRKKRWRPEDHNFVTARLAELGWPPVD